MTNNFDQFSDQKYLNLETYKKDGTPVKTPVWFVIDNGVLYVVTRESTGKVKRLKNNSKVKICSCSFNGKPKGEWLSGNMTLVDDDEAKTVISLRKKKYGIKTILVGLVTKRKGKLIVYSIILD